MRKPQRLALITALSAALSVPSDATQPAKRILTTLHSFTGQNGDGAYTVAGVVIDASGSLYGTTVTGGSFSLPLLGGCGTVFQLMPPAVTGGIWNESVIHSFGCIGDGATPNAGVVLGTNGALYGTTYYGGLAGCADNLGCGTVFELTPPGATGGTWNETILYRFTGGLDGANPEGGLVIGTIGELYGTTVAGGSGSCPVFGIEGCGTVFELTPPMSVGAAWTETVLHSFAGGDDGALPRGGAPVIGAHGAIYGTTQDGGGTACSGFGCGTVFELTRPATQGGTWTETVLHNFTGGSDGASPDSGLAIRADGALYGTTSMGGGGSCPLLGSEGCGTVFRLAPSEAVLYSSPGGSAGAYLLAGPVIGKREVLYGASAFGGPLNASCPNMGCGTVFELIPLSAAARSWTAFSLHTFTDSDGATPFGTLVIGAGGALYGTTYYGGLSNYGTVFRLAP